MVDNVSKRNKDLDIKDDKSRTTEVTQKSKQVEEKERLKKTGETFTNSLNMTFTYIPPGTFMMGSPKYEPGRGNDESQHEVTLTQGFYMQTSQVTVGQWRLFKEKGVSDFLQKIFKKTDKNWDNPGFEQTDDHPVTWVSWNDAKKFIRWLSKKEGKPYRLPTEAEWEYACLAGNMSRYCFGDDESLLTEYAWYYKNSGNRTHPVRTKKPNDWGLYDMHGNICDWCEDYYGKYPYRSLTDPTGPSEGSLRVFRGGCWFSDVLNCRSAYRGGGIPDHRNGYVGFRVLLFKS